MSARRKQLDTAIQVVTPENIAFEHRIAGPFRRLPAYVIDYLIRAVIIFGFVMLAGFALTAFGISVGASFETLLGLFGLTGLLMLFGLTFFYGGLFETIWNGQTPGKRLTGLRVVSIDGTPINAMQAVLRNVLRFVDSFPALPLFILIPESAETALGLLLIMTYQVGLFAMLATPRYQRLGDLVCGTLVVVEQRQAHYGVVRVDEPEVVRLAADLPADLTVTRSLGQALSAYVGRRRFFPPGRRADIARHVGEPLRRKFRLPEGMSHDLILCAVYYRTFIAEQGAIEAPPSDEPPFALRPIAADAAGWAPSTMTSAGVAQREGWNR